jgi:hypothetical protein
MYGNRRGFSQAASTSRKTHITLANIHYYLSGNADKKPTFFVTFTLALSHPGEGISSFHFALHPMSRELLHIGRIFLS